MSLILYIEDVVLVSSCEEVGGFEGGGSGEAEGNMVRVFKDSDRSV